MLLICFLIIGDPIDDMQKLAGCWILERGQMTIEEMWMPPKGGVMLGVSRVIRDGQCVSTEFIEIRTENDQLFYIAHPSGQQTTKFKLTSLENGTAVFENPEHDFPQKIVYSMLGERLEAYIEGPSMGQTRKIPFHYNRQDCP